MHYQNNWKKITPLRLKFSKEITFYDFLGHPVIGKIFLAPFDFWNVLYEDQLLLSRTNADEYIRRPYVLLKLQQQEEKNSIK